MVIKISPQELSQLQKETTNIRNICIIAHVDHGKTTAADCLISSNGIISEKLAGKMRYLDSTDEEQTRGITMQSSAISLLYQPENTNTNTTVQAQPDKKEQFLINLIDSPGHVDFSSDVSAAVRLCDGALLLVDVVEGVCAQTHAVLRQAWQENVKPCLVLNKMDRLIVELQLSPEEAYQHICRIIEQINVIISSMITADALEQDGQRSAGSEGSDDSKANTAQDDSIFCLKEWTLEVDEKKEQQLFFAPHRGNVVFGSAYDGWAFGIGYFVNIFAKKLDLPPHKLRKWLWGDYYFNPKTKAATRKRPKANSVPMFVQMVLQPIWEMYSAVQINPDVDRAKQMLRALRIAKFISDRELNHSDRRIAVQSVMRKWLPLSSAVLRMVVRYLPNPVDAQHTRIHGLWPQAERSNESLRRVYNSIEACELERGGEESPVVVYVSKITSVDCSLISDYNTFALKSDTDEVLVAFCRVFCGVLRPDKRIYVLGPKYHYENGAVDGDIEANPHVDVIEPNTLRLYMIMGRELVALSQVPAGNVVGIVGLKDFVLKTATLSSTIQCPSLTKMPFQAKPIVRVAVEPEDPRHFPQLEQGLQMLYRSDPTVEVIVQETGEHVIMALGELHLERCIADLRDRFSRVPLRVSPPIVSFRETIVDGTISSAQLTFLKQNGSEYLPHKGKEVSVSGIVKVAVPSGVLSLCIRALPLPIDVSQAIEDHADTLRAFFVDKLSSDENLVDLKKLEKVFIDSSSAIGLENEDADFVSRIWACGPRKIGPNILINNITGFAASQNIFSALNEDGSPEQEDPDNKFYQRNQLLRRIENSLITGFQMATTTGPLCDEPVWGVAFVIDDVEFSEEQTMEESQGEIPDKDADSSMDGIDKHSDTYGPISGQVISTMKKACLFAFLARPARLVEAVYSCSLQCPSEQLGKAYAVFSKRRGTVLQEDLSDGTSLFVITAHLPVVESFGFASDLLSSTSGIASSPQLRFSHWQVMDLDPFYQPTTEQEREDHGERIYEQNYVRKYIDSVRERKGLATEKKVVVHADKQRTLARKK